MKPPANYEYKPIYKHFQRKVLHPDSKTATNTVVQTDFCDQVTSSEQLAQDQTPAQPQAKNNTKQENS